MRKGPGRTGASSRAAKRSIFGERYVAVLRALSLLFRPSGATAFPAKFGAMVRAQPQPPHFLLRNVVLLTKSSNLEETSMTRRIPLTSSGLAGVLLAACRSQASWLSPLPQVAAIRPYLSVQVSSSRRMSSWTVLVSAPCSRHC